MPQCIDLFDVDTEIICYFYVIGVLCKLLDDFLKQNLVIILLLGLFCVNLTTMEL
jgi:hypothetical protein